jgi:GNAT superfamily N-acetyltransferase
VANRRLTRSRREANTVARVWGPSRRQPLDVAADAVASTAGGSGGVEGASRACVGPWLAGTGVGGRRVGVRALLAEDKSRLLEAFEHLSPVSRRRRFLSAISQYTGSRLEALAGQRADRCALVAVRLDEPSAEIVAMGEFVQHSRAPTVAEPAVAVVDAYQGHRLGGLLWDLLIELARDRGITRFSGTLQDSNTPARRLLESAGAQLSPEAPGVLRADVDLGPRRHRGR